MYSINCDENGNYLFVCDLCLEEEYFRELDDAIDRRDPIKTYNDMLFCNKCARILHNGNFDKKVKNPVQNIKRYTKKAELEDKNWIIYNDSDLGNLFYDLEF